MILNMIGGSGSSYNTGLNFSVINCSSADALPSSAENNTIAVISNTKVNSWDLSFDQPLKRSGNKNLITYPFNDTTKTVNGVTFTDNKDGTVTATGTASAETYFSCGSGTYEIYLTAGTYTLSCGTYNSNCRVYTRFSYDKSTWTTWMCNGTSVTKTFTSDVYLRSGVVVSNGATISNVTVKPQLERGSSATSFVKGTASGHAWIGIGSSGDVVFNAINRNGIQIYPTYAKQFVSNAWSKNLDAYIYNGGKWVQFSTSMSGYYFNNGDQCTDVTGGWTAEGYDCSTVYPSYYYSNGNITDNKLTLQTYAEQGSQGSTNPEDPGRWTISYIGTKNAVSLKGASKLNINVNGSSNITVQDELKNGKPALHFCVLSSKNLSSLVKSIPIVNMTNEVATIDVSDLNGDYYLLAIAVTDGTLRTISASISVVQAR